MQTLISGKVSEDLQLSNRPIRLADKTVFTINIHGFGTTLVRAHAHIVCRESLNPVKLNIPRRLPSLRAHP